MPAKEMSNIMGMLTLVAGFLFKSNYQELNLGKCFNEKSVAGVGVGNGN